MSVAPRKIVRLYRYLAAKWAMRTLETGELRVSRLAELNDPCYGEGEVKPSSRRFVDWEHGVELKRLLRERRRSGLSLLPGERDDASLPT